MDRRTFVVGGASAVAGLGSAVEAAGARSQVVLDPDLSIIDSHHHLWAREGEPPYLLDAFLKDIAASGARITSSVYVGETALGNKMAEAAAKISPCRVAAAIIGNADVRSGDAIAEDLDRQMELAPGRFRGFRTMAMYHPDPAVQFHGRRQQRGVFESPGFPLAMKHVATRNLVYEVCVWDAGIPDVAAIADRFADVQFVLEHMGVPMLEGIDAAGRINVRNAWRKALQDLARRPNVVVKVGGMGMPSWGFGFDKRAVKPDYRELTQVWKPWIDIVIDVFGPDRCMMESNYPPDSAACSYGDLWNALKSSTADYSKDERAALFHLTAAKIYRI